MAPLGARWLRLRMVGPVALIAIAALFGARAGRTTDTSRATSSSPATIAPAAAPAAAVDARMIYLRDCSVCHGAQGLGTTTGPSLVGQGEAAVDYVLTTGRMPLPHPGATSVRRTPAYDAATIAALDAYVAALVPGGPAIPTVVPGDAAAGGVTYRAQCAACHQWGAQGGALLHREAPSLDRSTPTQVAEAVRVGPGTMPVFGDAAVDNTQLNDLAAYVQTLQHPDDRGGNPLWHLGPLAEGGLALLVVGLMLVGLRLIGSSA